MPAEKVQTELSAQPGYWQDEEGSLILLRPEIQHQHDRGRARRGPHENPGVKRLDDEFLERPPGSMVHELPLMRSTARPPYKR
jgi:hypothetical protein